MCSTYIYIYIYILTLGNSSIRMDNHFFFLIKKGQSYYKRTTPLIFTAIYCGIMKFKRESIWEDELIITFWQRFRITETFFTRDLASSGNSNYNNEKIYFKHIPTHIRHESRKEGRKNVLEDPIWYRLVHFIF